MDLLSLLTSSENLYKYLLIGGIGLLVLSLFYPINKRYELNCRKDLINKEISILNYNIDLLKKNTDNLESKKDKTIYLLDSINRLKRPNKTIKDSIKSSFSFGLDSLKKERHEIKLKEFEVEYNQQQISTLEKHISDFLKYENIFFWAGIVLSIAGIIGWFLLMKKAP